jgi:hypothetical protein
MMTNAPPLQPALPRGDDRIEDLSDLIDALIDVVVEENIALAMGLPASQSRLTQQKLVLADQFERWVADAPMRRILLAAPDRAMQQKVLLRIESLRQATDENMIRLRAAIEASQRRIDAIMAAAREQITGNSPYNASGRVNGQAAAYGTSFRA